MKFPCPTCNQPADFDTTSGTVVAWCPNCKSNPCDSCTTDREPCVFEMNLQKNALSPEQAIDLLVEVANRIAASKIKSAGFLQPAPVDPRTKQPYLN